MDFLAAAFSSVLSIIFFCLFVAGVLKLFQVATTLQEIKDLLQNQRRAEIPMPAARYPEAAASPYVSPVAAYKPPTVHAEHAVSSLTPLAHISTTAASSAASPSEVPMSGEAMLRALDLEMRLEEAGPTPHFVDTTVVPAETVTSAPHAQGESRP